MKKFEYINSTVVALCFGLWSYAVAWVLVCVFNWRYHDLIGINTETFYATSSVVVYSAFGISIWPIMFMVVWVILSDFKRNKKKKLFAKKLADANKQ